MTIARSRVDASPYTAGWGWPGMFSMLFSFFIFFILHIASLLPTISIVLVLAAAFVMLLIYPTSTLTILYREALILCPAFICIVSFLWSQYPSLTLYYGTQFAIVAVIGVHMAYWHRPGTIMGQMAASLLYLLISVYAQNKVAWLNQGASIEVGINGGKSYIGAIASGGALAALFVIQYGLATRRLVPVYAGILCFVTGLFAILAARASGSLVGIVVNGVTFFGLQWLSRMAPEYRAKILIVAVPIIVLCIIFGADIWAAVLQFFNKSADLTGRVFLWERARAAIEARPWLGTGFNGFWVIGNPDAEILWNYAGIKSKSGFNFHNTALEFAVAFGIPIAIGLCILFIVAIVRKISLTLETGDPSAAFGAAIVVDWISHAAFESGGIGTFNSSMLLLYFALSGTRIPRTASNTAKPRTRRLGAVRPRSPEAVAISS